MMRRIIPYILLCIFSSLLLADCASKKQIDPKVALPIAYGQLSAKSLPQYAPDLLAASTADMRLSLEQKGHVAIRLRGFVVMQPEDLFRLEVDGAIGSGSAIACNGQTLTLINSYEHTFYSFSGQNLSQTGLFPLPISCRDLVALLHGKLPAVPKNNVVFYDTYHSRIEATYKYKGLYWRVILSPVVEPPAQILLIELRENRRGEPLATIEFSDFNADKTGLMPHFLALSAENGKLRTVLKFDEYEMSSPDSSAFVLQKPRGYK